jgi:hypothetical protein
MLQDAGPNGAAPDQRHAVIWGALLDLRRVRATIEHALDDMTEKLKTLDYETTLTHAIAAGWEPEDGEEPEEDGGTTPPASKQAAARDDGRADAPDLDDLVERARDGLTTLQTLQRTQVLLPSGAFPSSSAAFDQAMEFVIDSIVRVIDDIPEISAAQHAADGMAAEAEPPA